MSAGGTGHIPGANCPFLALGGVACLAVTQKRETFTVSTTLADLPYRERRLTRGRRSARTPNRPHRGEPDIYRTQADALTAGVDIWHDGAWRTITAAPSPLGRTRVRIPLHRLGTVDYRITAIVTARA